MSYELELKISADNCLRAKRNIFDEDDDVKKLTTCRPYGKSASKDFPILGKCETGEQLRLKTNFFGLSIQPRIINQYELSARFPGPVIENDSRVDKVLKVAGVSMMKAFYESQPGVFNNGRFLYDGQRIVYTTVPLKLGPDAEFLVNFSHEGRKRSLAIKLKHTSSIDSKNVQDFYEGRTSNLDQRIIPPFDILFNQIYDLEYCSFQRKHFKRADGNEHKDDRGWRSDDRGDRDRRNDRDYRGGRSDRGHGNGHGDRGDRNFRGGRNGSFNGRGRGGGFNGSNSNPAFEYVRGFVDSVRPAEESMALNIHLTTGVSISKQCKSLVQFIEKFLNLNSRIEDHRFSPQDLARVNKIIKGLKIYTDYGDIKRIYIAASIDNKTPRSTKFIYVPRDKPEEQEEISVYDYHKKIYGHRILELPMVRVTGRKDTYLPLELCFFLQDQFLSKTKIDVQMQAEQLRVATRPADQYMRDVCEVARKSAGIDPKLLDDFGIKLNANASVEVTGRKLATPNLSGGQGRNKFHQTPSGREIRFVIFVLSTQGDERIGDRIKQGVERAAAGFPHLKLCLVKLLEPKSSEDIKMLFRNIKREKLDFAMFGIPERGHYIESSTLYNLIKHFGDQVNGLVSQCLDLKKIDRAGPAYFENLILKINGKLGGLNTIVDASSIGSTLPKSMNASRLMVIGVDVNHPAAEGEASIAASVGSYNSTFNRFFASTRAQGRNRNESVEDLKGMISELFTMYKERNGHYPNHLVIFRDGVSEGQFSQVLEAEKPQIKQAIAEVIGQDCAITLLVVQKTHCARFMLTQSSSGPGGKPTYNVPSGTVVDSKIVERGYQVFYLNSHFSPLGISKPAKYVLLMDENQFTATQLETLCFYLCFSSVRTRKPLSKPVAICYADLLAYRAKGYLSAHNAIRNEQSRASNINHKELIDQDKSIVEAHKAILHQPFYS